MNDILQKLRGINSEVKKTIITGGLVAATVSTPVQRVEEQTNIDENDKNKIELSQEPTQNTPESATHFDEYYKDIDYQVDTVKNTNTLGLYYSSRNIIVENYNTDNEQEAQKDNTQILIHEEKHKDDYKNGFFSLPLGKDNLYKANEHLEMAANIAEFIALRHQYLENPNAEIDAGNLTLVFEKYKFHTAIGEVTPNSQDPKEAEAEKDWIYQNVTQHWQEHFKPLYHETHLKSSENFATENENDEANYQETVNKLYSHALGGMDFSTSFRKFPDINGPIENKSLKNININQETIDYITEVNPYQEDMSIEQWQTLNAFAYTAKKMQDSQSFSSTQEQEQFFSKKGFFDYSTYTIDHKEKTNKEHNLKHVFHNQIKDKNYNPPANDENFNNKLKEIFKDINGTDFSETAQAYYQKNHEDIEWFTNADKLSQEYEVQNFSREKPGPFTSFINDAKNKITQTFSDGYDKVKSTLFPNEIINNNSWQTGSSRYKEAQKTEDYYEYDAQNRRVSDVQTKSILDLEKPITQEARTDFNKITPEDQKLIDELILTYPRAVNNILEDNLNPSFNDVPQYIFYSSKELKEMNENNEFTFDKKRSMVLFAQENLTGEKGKELRAQIRQENLEVLSGRKDDLSTPPKKVTKTDISQELISQHQDTNSQ